jgi:hypothetical protein
MPRSCSVFVMAGRRAPISDADKVSFVSTGQEFRGPGRQTPEVNIEKGCKLQRDALSGLLRVGLQSTCHSSLETSTDQSEPKKKGFCRYGWVALYAIAHLIGMDVRLRRSQSSLKFRPIGLQKCRRELDKLQDGAAEIKIPSHERAAHPRQRPPPSAHSTVPRHAHLTARGMTTSTAVLGHFLQQ